MIGAEALVRSLVASGVDVVFANPGTSEMHFVATLDAVPEMRGVLALFEGAATGAADGYARMRETPAAVLLHLGPGLGNGLANLHNARRSHAPVVAIVGDHATYHKQYDAPLESDIDTVARNVSTWIRRSVRARGCRRGRRRGGRSRVRSAGTDRNADPSRRRLVVRGWVGGTAGAADCTRHGQRSRPSKRSRPRCARMRIRRSCSAAARFANADIQAACRIAQATGAEVLAETFPARAERGARDPGDPAPGVPRGDGRGAARRAAPSHPRRHDVARCRSSRIPASRATSCPTAARSRCSRAAATTPWLRWKRSPSRSAPSPDPAIADASKAREAQRRAERRVDCARDRRAAARGRDRLRRGEHQRHVPSRCSPPALPRHDWLSLTGGSIGQGLPVALGAAIACPDRPVLALEADGSALYTLQSLWTMAREQLDVTTVIFSNRRYAILRMELARVGATASGAAGTRDARHLAARDRLRRARARLRGPRHPAGERGRRSQPTSSERSPSRARTSSRR